MNYLLCLIDGKQDYTEISEEQEHKINNLIKSQRIPQEFQLNNKLVQSATILGFTHKKVVDGQAKPKFESWKEFRAWAHQQEWYRKHKSTFSQGDTASTDNDASVQQSLVST